MEVKTQGQPQGRASKIKSAETQITVTLLVVTFSFLILTTPAYIILILSILVEDRNNSQRLCDVVFPLSIRRKIVHYELRHKFLSVCHIWTQIQGRFSKAFNMYER